MPLVFATSSNPETPFPSRPRIVSGILELLPLAVDGYESSRRTTSLVHEILGRAKPDITMRPATSRTGTLSLVFATEADSLAAELAHAEARVFTLDHPARSSVGMDYVPAGRVTRALLPSGGWSVTVDFQEV